MLQTYQSFGPQVAIPAHGPRFYEATVEDQGLFFLVSPESGGSELTG